MSARVVGKVIFGMEYPFKVAVFGASHQSCQPTLMAWLGLFAWQVRGPGQAEILSFGLASFGPDTAVPGQAELVDPVSLFLNNYHWLCTNFFLFLILIEYFHFHSMTSRIF